MTKADMTKAGKLSQLLTLTDAELALALEGMTLTLAFVEGMGSGWKCVADSMRQRLDRIEVMNERRKERREAAK